VCAGSEEHLEGDVGGLGGIADDIFGVIGFLHGGAEVVEFVPWKKGENDVSCLGSAFLEGRAW
jgi:hypothetical protein